MFISIICVQTSILVVGNLLKFSYELIISYLNNNSISSYIQGVPKKIGISVFGLFEALKGLRSKKFRSLTPSILNFTHWEGI